ncbi:MAG TPA: AsmA-like C-terminal region-containing protein [Bacteroidales bacterium]
MKKFLIILASIIVLFVAFLLAVPYLFKDEILQLVKTEINKNVNATVDFQDFSLSFFKNFPDLTAELDELSVVGKDRFANDTLIYAGKLGLGFNIMDLIGGNYTINEIYLSKVNINALINADGVTNYDIVPESTDTISTQVTEEPSEELLIKLKSFRIHDANIYYKDDELVVETWIKGMDLSLSGDFTASKADIKTQLTAKSLDVIYEKVRYIKKMNLAVDAVVDADLEKYLYVLKENEIKLNQFVLKVDGWVGETKTGYDMDLAVGLKKSSLKDLLSIVPEEYMSDMENLKAEGKLAFDAKIKGVYDDDNMPAYFVNLKLENGTLTYPDLPAKIENLQLALKIDNPDGITDHTAIDLKSSANFTGNSFQLDLRVKQPVSDPDIDGKLVADLDLKNLGEFITIDENLVSGQLKADLEFRGIASDLEKEDLGNFYVQGKISGDNFHVNYPDTPELVIDGFAINFTPQQITLDRFDAKMGQSDMKLTGKFENLLSYYFKNETLKANFSFYSSFINLNDFLGETESSETPEETTPVETVETAETTPAPVDSVTRLPENIDFLLKTNIVKLSWDDIEVSNINGNLKLKNGKASLEQLSMNLLGGGMNGNMSYDTKDTLKLPLATINMNMANIDIPQTFTAFNTIQRLAPIAKYCTGKIGGTLELTSRLKPNYDLDLNTVESYGNLRTGLVKIKNADALKKLSQALQLAKFSDDISVDDINISYVVHNGKLTMKPFKSKILGYPFEFGGWQGLDQTLHYNMIVDLPLSMLGAEANKLIDNLTALAGKNGVKLDLNKTIPVNIAITGTVPDPKFGVGLSNLNLTDNFKDQLKDELNAQKDEALKLAHEQAAKLLAEAEKQGDMLIAEAEKQAAKLLQTIDKSAEDLKAETQKQIDDLVKQAGNDIIAKTLAKKAGEELKKQSDKEIEKLKSDAVKQSDQLVNVAKQQKATLVNAAQKQGDALIEQADAKKF